MSKFVIDKLDEDMVVTVNLVTGSNLGIAAAVDESPL